MLMLKRIILIPKSLFQNIGNLCHCLEREKRKKKKEKKNSNTKEAL